MVDGFGEPTTEEEAREIERFLQSGAETTVEVLQTYEAQAEAEASTDSPGLLEFAVTGDELARGLAESADRQLRLALDLTLPEGAAGFSAAVFLNNRDATPDAATAEDPSFIGAVGFFPAGSHDQHDEEGSARYELPLAARQLENLGEEQVFAAVVMVPLAEEADDLGGVRVSGATISLIQSLVEGAT